MRIYELSKILNVPSKEIIKVARDEFEIQGLKSHMSSVSELQAAKIQKYYIKGKESQDTKEEVKKDKKKCEYRKARERLTRREMYRLKKEQEKKKVNRSG